MDRNESWKEQNIDDIPTLYLMEIAGVIEKRTVL